MQRRKPMTAKHQERRRRALERLEARVDSQKDGPNERQLSELASLRDTLRYRPGEAAQALDYAERTKRQRDEDTRYNLA